VFQKCFPKNKKNHKENLSSLWSIARSQFHILSYNADGVSCRVRA